MRRFHYATLAAVAVFVFPSMAFAADLPVKAKPVAFHNWTGFYIGANVGGAWGSNDTENSVISGANGTASAIAQSAGQGTARGSGFTGGGQIGYNWQFARWVTGLEADFQALSLKQTRTSPIVSSGVANAQDFDEVKHNWLATFRARAGYAWDRSLLYVTGGIAVADTQFSRTQSWSFDDACPIDPRNGFDDCHVGSVTKTSVGPTVGAGWEYAFSENWSVKAEYLHVWLPSVNFVTTSPTNSAQQFTQTADRSNIDIARLGVNYHFGN